VSWRDNAKVLHLQNVYEIHQDEEKEEREAQVHEQIGKNKKDDLHSIFQN